MRSLYAGKLFTIIFSLYRTLFTHFFFYYKIYVIRSYFKNEILILLTFKMRTMRFNLFKISRVLDSSRTSEILFFWMEVWQLEVPFKVPRLVGSELKSALTESNS